ncbi:MAG TPA: DUF3291 domain-containing protein [Labilithrix sp.]|jgi:heme-degrading monooxygenase HmoA
MALVSLTRLHLRSILYFPSFVFYAQRSVRQASASEGFVEGATMAEMPRALGFWTMTLWRDVEAMRAFRNAAAHLEAMKRLPRWCDESAVTHYESDALPSMEEAHRRMRESGKLTKVRNPSALHAAGKACTDRVPRAGQRFAARAR